MMDDKIATSHADLRLLQRAREFDKSLTELWEDGIECEVKYQSYDTARVIPSREIVLLMQDRQIVTVLDDVHNVTVSGERLQDYIGGALDGTETERLK